MRDVEIDALRAQAFDFRVDRARDDVPRRERALRVIALHEIFPAAVAQNSPFPTHGFRNEK